MAKTRECCSALSLRRTGDDLHVSLHKGFKIRLAGIVPVSLEFTGVTSFTASQFVSSDDIFFGKIKDGLKGKELKWRNGTK